MKLKTSKLIVSIIVPIHNEEKTIRELTERVNKTLTKNYKDSWELLLVDDISSDNSFNLMKEMAEKYKNVRIFQHEKKGGQTGGFKTGFDNAKGEIVITIDGDLQLMPEDIPLFVDKMHRGYEVVNAVREKRKHSFFLKLVSRIYNVLMLIFFDCPTVDSASNYTAFRADLMKNLNLTNNDHRYIVPIAMRRGAKVVGEVVVQHEERAKGKSNYGGIISKAIQGGPEIFFTWMRIKNGRYDSKD